MKIQQEQFDRVWQRVHPGEVPACAGPVSCPTPLPELAAEALWAAEEFSRLARGAAGMTARRLRALAQEKRAQAVLLRGLCTVTGSSLPPVKPRRDKGGSLRQVLRQGCVRELRWLERCREQQAEAFGPVLAGVVQRQQVCCQVLLELLGESERPARPRR